jgi:hypothetical protein
VSTPPTVAAVIRRALSLRLAPSPRWAALICVCARQSQRQLNLSKSRAWPGPGEGCEALADIAAGQLWIFSSVIHQIHQGKSMHYIRASPSGTAHTAHASSHNHRPNQDNVTTSTVDTDQEKTLQSKSDHGSCCWHLGVAAGRNMMSDRIQIGSLVGWAARRSGSGRGLIRRRA